MPHSGRILCHDVIPSAVRGGGPRRAYRTRGLRMRHGIIFRSRTGLRLGPVDGSCGAANTNFCKQLLGYSRVSAAEELRGRVC